jgi:hypothetical protein
MTSHTDIFERVPDLITLQEAVEKFDVGIATVYRHLKAGRLQRYKRGGHEGRGVRTYVDRAELRRVLQPQPVPRSRIGYIRTKPLPVKKPSAKLRQREGETDKAFAARIDAAREAAYAGLASRRPKR